MLLFGSETWVLTSSIMQRIKGVHVVFLQKATGKKEKSLGDKTWRKEEVDSVFQAIGIKTHSNYINKRQAKVAE